MKTKLKIAKIDLTEDNDKLIKIDIQNASKEEKDVKIWLLSGILYNLYHGFEEITLIERNLRKKRKEYLKLCIKYCKYGVKV